MRKNQHHRVQARRQSALIRREENLKAYISKAFSDSDEGIQLQIEKTKKEIAILKSHVSRAA